MQSLTDDLKTVQRDYSSDGVVLLRNILTSDWLDKLRAAVDREVLKGERYFAYKNMRAQPGTFQDYCLTSDIGRRVAEVAGASWSSLIYDQLFVKEPGTRTQTGWHTDQPYWPVAGPIMTMWIALDPVDPDNGALEFVRGSHAWGAKYRPFKTDQMGAFSHYLELDNPDYIDMPDFEADRDRYDIFHFPQMEPGDALAFDGMTVHSAMGNRTSDPPPPRLRHPVCGGGGGLRTPRRRHRMAARSGDGGGAGVSERDVSGGVADSSLTVTAIVGWVISPTQRKDCAHALLDLRFGLQCPSAKNGFLIAACWSRALGRRSAGVTVLSEVGRCGSLHYGVGELAVSNVRLRDRRFCPNRFSEIDRPPSRGTLDPPFSAGGVQVIRWQPPLSIRTRCRPSNSSAGSRPVSEPWRRRPS
jgi:ectoine hydroxylase-related dioxygenase (phytanoyl-CoA dioxygenase family)